MKTINLKTNQRRMLADLQTPVGIYLKIRDMYLCSVLLESSDYHTAENSFSYIAFNPIATYKVIGSKIIQKYADSETMIVEVKDKYTVPDTLNDFIKSHQTAGASQIPGTCGFFGYTSFESVRYFEDVKLMPYSLEQDGIPEIQYIMYKYVVMVNHFNNEMILTETLLDSEESGLSDIETLLDKKDFGVYDFTVKGEESSDITDKEYMNMVSKGKDYCHRGDVFQIVLSRRYRQEYRGDDIMLYRALRSINPSPYLFYFDFGTFRVFGSSPESHLVVKDGMAYISPIAGTFKRTGDDEKDRIIAEALRNDPKENAEHVMLVDLARNDLSRNAHDVRVEVFRDVQYYSHLLHLVSLVSGKLSKGTNLVRLFADTFPAGTLSGAPKVKAINLVSRIEKHKRGLYGGCIGFIGLDGSFNQAITIRSFVSKDNMLYYQAGAGIVAKSDESCELQEVNNKLAALKLAIDKADINKMEK